jgi:hypothetical protein
MTDLSKIIKEIGSIIGWWLDFDTIVSNPDINPDYDEDDVDEIFTEEYKEKEFDTFIEDIYSLCSSVSRRIRNGDFDDRKYHKDMSELFKLLFVRYEYVWDSYDGLEMISSILKKRIKLYMEEIVKPYPGKHRSLIRETTGVLKSETPISEDNICDILSYLTDETVITKHEVDTFVYAGV